MLGWSAWRNWPRAQRAADLPASLSTLTISNIEEAMKVYSAPKADLTSYTGAGREDLKVTPAVEIPPAEEPGPALSE